MRPGVTDVSNEVFELHMLIFYICCAIRLRSIFRNVLLHVSLHQKKNPEPAKFHEHTGLEIMWTVVPFLILVGMAIPKLLKPSKRYTTMKKVRSIFKLLGTNGNGSIDTLRMILSFFSNLSTDMDEIYNLVPKGENYLLEVDEPLVIPTNTRVRFLITANDVIHSWWVPDFAIKQDAIPGFINTAWTEVSKPGIYRGNCTELCGKNHGFMPVVVKAVEMDEYTDWVMERKELLFALLNLQRKSGL